MPVEFKSILEPDCDYDQWESMGWEYTSNVSVSEVKTWTRKNRPEGVTKTIDVGGTSRSVFCYQKPKIW